MYDAMFVVFKRYFRNDFALHDGGLAAKRVVKIRSCPRFWFLISFHDQILLTLFIHTTCDRGHMLITVLYIILLYITTELYIASLKIDNNNITSLVYELRRLYRKIWYLVGEKSQKFWGGDEIFPRRKNSPIFHLPSKFFTRLFNPRPKFSPNFFYFHRKKDSYRNFPS